MDSVAEDLKSEHDYAAEKSVITGELANALRSPRLLGDDPFLSMQASNIDVVDSVCMALEQQTLKAPDQRSARRTGRSYSTPSFHGDAAWTADASTIPKTRHSRVHTDTFRTASN